MDDWKFMYKFDKPYVAPKPVQQECKPYYDYDNQVCRCAEGLEKQNYFALPEVHYKTEESHNVVQPSNTDTYLPPRPEGEGYDFVCNQIKCFWIWRVER